MSKIPTPNRSITGDGPISPETNPDHWQALARQHQWAWGTRRANFERHAMECPSCRRGSWGLYEELHCPVGRTLAVSIRAAWQMTEHCREKIAELAGRPAPQPETAEPVTLF